MSEPAKPESGVAVWGVTSLLLAASDALTARFGAVVVRGELSGFTRASSGHCYFSLKDADGQPGLLRCAMFRRAAALTDFVPQDGQQVQLRGRIAVYEARGELQLVVEAMQRVGAGALYEEFLRLRARLQAEGLFDPEPKRRPARFPFAVGIVASASSAALHDVLTSFARRAPHVPLVLYPSLVQGPQAPASLVAALQAAGQRRDVETLLLVRGGGSLEDLWAFNDERVVRAVRASRLPVICGVGHETDVTLADLAADLRAPTPTAAAELACEMRSDALDQLKSAAVRARQSVRRQLDEQAQRLDTLALRSGRPARGLGLHRQTLHNLGQRLHASLVRHNERQREAMQRRAERLQRAAAAVVGAWRHHLQLQDRRLLALDPKLILGRGFAWVEDSNGRAVTSTSGLAAGQRLRLEWSDGLADADIRKVTRRSP